jgi:hypothetical protein
MVSAFRPTCPTLLAAALSVLPLRFDDPTHPQSQPPLPGVPAKKDDPHAEMRRLFGEIEKDLRAIDHLLSDASVGTTSASVPMKKPEGAITGIDRLLDASAQRTRTVIAGIDRILELANHPHPPGGT